MHSSRLASSKCHGNDDVTEQGNPESALKKLCIQTTMHSFTYSHYYTVMTQSGAIASETNIDFLNLASLLLASSH